MKAKSRILTVPEALFLGLTALFAEPYTRGMDNLRGKKVLVVAADTASRDAVAEEFQKAGCSVLSLTGGVEAYEAARDRSVDAVVTSARLSNGDATRLLNDIRRINYETPVVLYGAGSEEISANEAIHVGFSAHFRQPYPTSALAEAVSRSLRFVEERKKKKVERVAVAGQAELSFGEPPLRLRAPVLNLSRGGIFVSIDRDFPQPETLVAYELFLADDSKPALSGNALVRWVRDNPRGGQMPGVGLEFHDLPASALALIEEHMRRADARRNA
jgi:CheY-like chemotaxis protein